LCSVPAVSGVGAGAIILRVSSSSRCSGRARYCDASPASSTAPASPSDAATANAIHSLRTIASTASSERATRTTPRSAPRWNGTATYSICVATVLLLRRAVPCPCATAATTSGRSACDSIPVSCGAATSESPITPPSASITVTRAPISPATRSASASASPVPSASIPATERACASSSASARPCPHACSCIARYTPLISSTASTSTINTTNSRPRIPSPCDGVGAAGGGPAGVVPGCELRSADIGAATPDPDAPGEGAPGFTTPPRAPSDPS
jgi:hypothetical protein